MIARTRRFAAVALTLVAALLLTGCDFNGAYDLPLPGKPVKDDQGYLVTADFNDVVNVVPRTLVMANDVPVGQVESVKRVGWHARITMRVRKDIVLPKTATADVRQTSLLGEKFIQLAAPPGVTVAKAGRLGNGDRISLANTSRNPEVEEVLGALSFLLSGGGVGQIKTISVELNKMMDGRTADLRGVLQRLDEAVGVMNAQKGDIIRAMEAIDSLTATLNKEGRTIGAALDSFGPALRVLNKQHGQLVAMLKALDELGRVGTRVIGQSKDNVIATLRHLQPTLREMADAGDSLPRGLMMLASFPFPDNAGELAQGDYSNALFAMNFDFDKLARAGLKGGDTGLPNVSQLCALYAGSGSCAPLMSALCSVSNINVFCAPSGGIPTPPSPLPLPGGASGSNPLDGLFSPGGIFGGLTSGSSATGGGTTSGSSGGTSGGSTGGSTGGSSGGSSGGGLLGLLGGGL